MHFVFYRTADVFAAEELLQDKGIQTNIVPTPVQDKAYCGVCVEVSETDSSATEQILSDFEFQKVL